jgi:hypothetical protein
MFLQPIAIEAVAVDVVTFSEAINKFDHINPSLGRVIMGALRPTEK